jgi:hypothetical protein
MAARRTDSGRARAALAAAAALAALAASAASAGAGIPDAEFDEAVIYHTAEVPPDRAIDFTVTCPSGWWAVSGTRHSYERGPFLDLQFAFVRPYNRVNFRVRNYNTTETGRLTVAVVCRRARPKPSFKPVLPSRPSGLVLSGGNYYVDLQPGEQRTANTPCPATPTPPKALSPGGAAPAPRSPGRSTSSPAGLGHHYVDLEPGSPRARVAGATARVPQLVDVVPTAHGFRVTVAGADRRTRVLLQALCLKSGIPGRDAEGDRVTRRVDVDRFSLPQTLRPGQGTFGAGCPTGSAPLSSGYDLPAPLPVARSFGRSPQASWAFFNPGSQPATLRLHLLCLPGRLVLVRGRTQVDTTVGPITITQG